MSQITNALSKVGSLIVALGGFDVSASGDLNGNSITIGTPSFNVLGSVENREVQGSFPYTTSDGVAHTLAFTTKQRNDGSDVVSIDGVQLTSPNVDNDLHWAKDTVQFRGNDATDTPQQLEVTVTVGVVQKVIATVGGEVGGFLSKIFSL